MDSSTMAFLNLHQKRSTFISFTLMLINKYIRSHWRVKTLHKHMIYAEQSIANHSVTE